MPKGFFDDPDDVAYEQAPDPSEIAAIIKALHSDDPSSADFDDDAAKPKPILQMPVQGDVGKPILQMPVQNIISQSSPGKQPEEVPQGTLQIAPQTITSTPRVLAGGTPANSIRSTPQQATTDYLNLNKLQQDIALQGGDNDQITNQLLANKEGEAANEKIQQAQDYQKFLDKSLRQQDELGKQAQQAYADFKSKAGSLKDPSSEYWGDKGMGSRILSGLALFSSGFGAAMIGKGGNPYLDYLNQQIEKNFEAHKKNIDDLYEGQVAAGHIADTAENRAKFEEQAKLTHYDLSSAHIAPELRAIGDQATGERQKLAAYQAAAGLEANSIGLKQNLAHNEAVARAAAYAAARDRQRKVQEAFTASLDRHKDLPPEEQRTAAFSDMAASGYNRSDLAPMAEGLQIPYDSKKGRWNVPVSPKPTNPGEPSIDPDTGAVVIPSVDAAGHSIKPEEQVKMQKDAIARRVVVDGKYALANSSDDAHNAQAMFDANHDVEKDVNRMEAIDKELAAIGQPTSPKAIMRRQALIGDYHATAAQLIVHYNRASTAVARATGQGEAETLQQEAIPEAPSLAGINADLASGRARSNAGKIASLRSTIQDNKNAVNARLGKLPAQGQVEQPLGGKAGEAMKPRVDPFAAFGGKKL